MKRLDDIEKKNPFKVPEGYFTEVNDRIFESVSGVVPQVKKKSVYIRMRPFIAVAASVALLISVAYGGYRLLNGKNAFPAMPEISTEELAGAYLNEFDVQIFEETVKPNLQSLELPEMSREEIIECLLSENIGLEEIYENL